MFLLSKKRQKFKSIIKKGLQKFPKLYVLVKKILFKYDNLKVIFLKLKVKAFNLHYWEYPDLAQPRQLLVDVTSTHEHDLRTGIERVARALLLSIMKSQHPGWNVKPVYLYKKYGQWFYKYANKYSAKILNLPNPNLQEDYIVEVWPGDILITLDCSFLLIESRKSKLHKTWRQNGVKIFSMIHDLLPISHSEFFPKGTKTWFSSWLKSISEFDGVIAISKNVAEQLAIWMRKNVPYRKCANFSVYWYHHGADIESSSPTIGLPLNASEVLAKLAKNTTFLMVGTIEPRKNYLQALEAFTLLWAEGFNVNLVIVGHEGWKHLPEKQRKNIPQTVEQIRKHPELGRHLYWLEGISDEYLQKIYQNSSVLIATSVGEGFGLPLIEGARYNLPIIARDIPIFREITSNKAYFFSGTESKDLELAIKKWLVLYTEKKHPLTEGLKINTWEECAENILTMIKVKSESNSFIGN